MRIKYKRTRLKRKYTPSSIVWYIFKYLFYILMVLFASSFIYLILWLFINSLKSATEFATDTFSLPASYDWANYKEILSELKYKGYGILGMLWNTLKLTGFQILCAVTLPHMAAYALARFDTKFGKALEAIVWITMAIPVVGSSAAWMWFFNRTNLYDTFTGAYLMRLTALGFNSILLTNFYRGVSPAYREAAYMDGASELRVFVSIYYPQAKAITMITVINTFIGGWNDYLNPYMYLPSHPVLALGLQQLQAQFVYYGNDYPVMFAGILIVMIPVLILYFRFSKEILSNAGVGMK